MASYGSRFGFGGFGGDDRRGGFGGFGGDPYFVGSIPTACGVRDCGSLDHTTADHVAADRIEAENARARRGTRASVVPAASDAAVYDPTGAYARGEPVALVRAGKVDPRKVALDAMVRGGVVIERKVAGAAPIGIVADRYGGVGFVVAAPPPARRGGGDVKCPACGFCFTVRKPGDLCPQCVAFSRR